MTSAWIDKLNTLSPRKQLRNVALLLTVLAFVFYGNSLSNGYALDDEYVTNTNTYKGDAPINQAVTKGFSGLGEIWTSSYVKSEKQSFEYRPMVLTTFAIEYQLFGQNPGVSHFVNLLFYILNCMLIFVVLRLVFKDLPIVFPLLVVLLFLIHPLHSEVVNNLKSRDELLVMTGGMIALYAALKLTDKFTLKHLLIVLVGLLFAFLSKRTSLMFLGVMPLFMLFYNPKKWKLALGVFAVVVVSGLLFLLIKTGLVGHGNERVLRTYENPLYIDKSFANRITMAGYCMAWYIKQLCFPFELISYYGSNTVPLVGWGNPVVWFGWIVHAGVAFFGFKHWKRRNPIALGILLYLGVVLLFSNLLSPAVGIIADRFAYMSSLGFCIAIGWLSWHFLGKAAVKPSKLLVLAFLGITVLCAARVITRNPDWNSRVDLFTADAAKSPESVKLHALLGNALTDYDSRFRTIKDSLAKANQRNAAAAKQANREYKPITLTPEMAGIVATQISHYKTAVTKFRSYDYMYNNLGVAYLSYTNKYDSAVYYLQEAVLRDSTFYQAAYNLGVAYERLGNATAAVQAWNQTVQIKPDFLEAHQKMVTTLITLKEFDKALQALLQWEAMIPPAQGHYYEAFLEQEMTAGRFEPATGIAEAIKRMFPQNEKVHGDLVKLYHNSSKPEEAIAAAKENISAFPASPPAYTMLANLYLQYERYDEAIAINSEAADKFANQPIFAMSVGDIFVNVKKEIETALSWYDRAYSTNPTDKKLCEYIARICADNGLANQAEIYFQRAQGL
jgi:tetratricopeptide (TPR) repeat protein